MIGPTLPNCKIFIQHNIYDGSIVLQLVDQYELHIIWFCFLINHNKTSIVIIMQYYIILFSPIYI